MSPDSRSAFVIPVRTLGQGKTRLSGWFDAGQRAELVAAMLQDLLAAAEAGAPGTRRVVVTADPAVGAIAHDCGSEVLMQRDDEGIGSALEFACRGALDAGDSCIALPADLPFASASDLAALAEAAREHEVVIVPDRRGEGTNALAFRLPRCFGFHWGHRSFSQHLVSAHSWGASPKVLQLSTLMHDLDVPDDLFHGLAARESWRAGRRAARWLRHAAGSPHLLPTW